ncbi:MAG: potassium-transporting ATPase subunit KdpC [Acidobacteria bacterium]|nr:potassium-transporting ATPase subunit KdpC [Acidobacteriota bacterium]
MHIGRHVLIAVLMTVAMTVLLGLVYPLVVTGLAQLAFSDRANGQLIYREGRLVGSRLLGQPFSAPRYFHGRPSAAGRTGYDASASGGTNLGPTNRVLIAVVRERIAAAGRERPNVTVPIDMVTASASGLDPHIFVASAEFQVPRIARERGMGEGDVRAIVTQFTEGRDLGFLGERRVNVLLLNLALDERQGRPPSSSEKR